MKTVLLSFTLVGLLFITDLAAASEDRFIVIADAQVPDLMKSMQNVGVFAEKIMPGSQILITGSVIALNFNPDFASFDMASKLQVSAYGDTKNQEDLPVVCGVAGYKKNHPVPKIIKLGKKDKLFVKTLNDKALIASSEILLDNVKTFEKTAPAESDLVICLFPDRYLKQCPGNIAYLRNMLEKELEQEGKKDVLDNQQLEKILKQCEKMEINVKAEPEYVNISLLIQPVKDLELARFIKTTDPGNIAAEKILKLGKSISGNQTFSASDGLNGIVSKLLGKFFNKGNSQPFEQLCDIKASHDKTNLLLQANISQVALHKALIKSGLVKFPQGETSKINID